MKLTFLYNKSIMEMLESPPGTSMYFYIRIGYMGINWERNILKAEEYFETSAQFLKTKTYLDFAKTELVYVSRIPITHWQYNHN